MTLDERLELLLKPLWKNSDIMNYLSVSSATASKIRNIAIKKHDGLFIGDTKKVRRNAVLNAVNNEDLIIEQNILKMKGAIIDGQQSKQQQTTSIVNSIN